MVGTTCYTISIVVFCLSQLSFLYLSVSVSFCLSHTSLPSPSLYAECLLLNLYDSHMHMVWFHCISVGSIPRCGILYVCLFKSYICFISFHYEKDIQKQVELYKDTPNPITKPQKWSTHGHSFIYTTFTFPLSVISWSELQTSAVNSSVCISKVLGLLKISTMQWSQLKMNKTSLKSTNIQPVFQFPIILQLG